MDSSIPAALAFGKATSPMPMNQDIWHLIAQEMDLDDIASLAQTNKAFFSLLHRNKQSICAVKLRTFNLKPLSKIFRSPSLLVADSCSIAGIRALSSRRAYTEAVLHGGFLSTDTPTHLDLTPAAMSKLRRELTRAIELADQIADHATIDYDPTSQDPSAGRRAQIAYIQQLNKEDLARLCTLTALAEVGFDMKRFRGPVANLRDFDPTCQMMAFKENVLRRGTAAICNTIGVKAGAKAWEEYLDADLMPIMNEIKVWETGQFVPRTPHTGPWIKRSQRVQPVEALPGLHMVMMQSLWRQLGCSIGKVGWEADKVISKIIGERFVFN